MVIDIKNLYPVIGILGTFAVISLILYLIFFNPSDAEVASSKASVSMGDAVSMDDTVSMAEAANLTQSYVLSANAPTNLVLHTQPLPSQITDPDAVLPDYVAFYTSTYHSTSYNNVTYTAEGDTLVVEITYAIDDASVSYANVTFGLTGGECVFTDGINEDGTIDLTAGPHLQVTDALGRSDTYEVVTRRQTCDIPVLYLSTVSGGDVTSRYEYVSANMVLDDVTYDLSIRGRGNASWWKFPQQSYMLKFDDSISLFGMQPSDKWVLASTYGDLSLIRNCVASDIASSMENLEYTAQQIPVDIFLNGTYLGVYTFSEKIEVDSDKINLFSNYEYRTMLHNGITDVSFFLECGGDLFDPHIYGQEYFFTAHSPRLFFEYPTFSEPNTEEAQYIIDYMNATDQALTRGYGYEEYIDIDSWVDWFIVMELTNNTDSSFCRSSFMYKRPGELLMLGPVWDFDMALGNFFYDNPTYQCWATAEPIYAPAQNHYMSYLYNSDSFMLAVRERWNECKEELLATALSAVEYYGAQVEASRVYNNPIRGVSNSSYQVDFLTGFIQRRYDWIDMSINMDDFNRHPATESLPTDETEEIPLLSGNEIISDNTAATVSENAAPPQ